MIDTIDLDASFAHLDAAEVDEHPGVPAEVGEVRILVPGTPETCITT